jgi:hypothetical protein
MLRRKLYKLVMVVDVYLVVIMIMDYDKNQQYLRQYLTA